MSSRQDRFGFATCVTVILLFALVATAFAQTYTPRFDNRTRPEILGTNGMVASGHPLASLAGYDMLKAGGNAFDAGVAMVLSMSFVEQDMAGFFGEVTQLFYSARDKRPYAIDGGSAAASSVDVAWFKEQGVDKIPGQGLLASGVPATPDALLLLLQEFGTMSFTEVSAAAIRQAEEGVPMYPAKLTYIQGIVGRMARGEWPGSRDLFMPGNRLLQVGDVYTNRALASMWRSMAEAEQEALAAGKSREEAIQAVRDFFYRGEIAEIIVEWNQTHSYMIDDLGKSFPGNLTIDDFTAYSARLEEPWHVHYNGYDVYKAGPWSQGPVFLQHLNLLKQFDLQELGYGTADYWHVMIETTKLAAVDRNEWYGDPNFIAVPKAGLLSEEYAKERAALIDMERAIIGATPGDPWPYNDTPKPETYPYLPGGYVPEQTFTAPSIWGQADSDWTNVMASLSPSGLLGDTSGTRAADRYGNLWSATNSGGWLMSNDAIAELGTMLGTRVQMFWVNTTEHAKSYVPGARVPSTSITATVVMKDGQPYMAIGMPGGDQQDVVTMQDFIAVVDFGFNIQDAVELPHVRVFDAPSVFYPHELRRQPGVIMVDKAMPAEVAEELERRGHIVRTSPINLSATTMVVIDPVTGILRGAAADNKLEYVIGW